MSAAAAMSSSVVASNPRSRTSAIAARVSLSRVCCRLRALKPGAAAPDFGFDALDLACLRAFTTNPQNFTSCKFALSAHLEPAAEIRNRIGPEIEEDISMSG